MNKFLILIVVFVTTWFYTQAQKPVLNTILTGYYNVEAALAKNDAKAAANASGDLFKAITSIDMSAIPAKDHMVFMKLQDKLSYDARHISESSDINHQREHFTSLSTNMATLAKQTHLSGQPIYEDYCPMKKAYWLSPDKTIKNPYLADMSDCGRITATIKP